MNADSRENSARGVRASRHSWSCRARRARGTFAAPVASVPVADTSADTSRERPDAEPSPVPAPRPSTAAHPPSAPPTARFELKFVVPPARLDAVLHAIRLDRHGIRDAYPPRVVQSVYFDSPALDAYALNLAGVAGRSKMRLRWYTSPECPELTLPVQARLETKIKRGLLGWKEVHAIDALTRVEWRTWRTLHRAVARRLPVSARGRLLRSPRAVVINRYLRSYFVAAGKRVRVTVDSALEAFDQLHTVRPQRKRRTPLPDVAVIEVKTDADHREELQDLVQCLPARVSRFSKYCVAVQGVLG